MYANGPAASSHGLLAHWAAAVVPYATSAGEQRVAVSCVLAVPAPEARAGKPDKASICWGIAAGERSAWEEPAAGWFTRPENSWDIARGAWGTKADAVSTIVADGSRLSAFRVVLDLPWRGLTRRLGGLAFKWCLGNDWIGDVATGGNLVVRMGYAAVYHSSAEEESDDESSQNGSAADGGEKSGKGASTDLLAGVSNKQAAALLAAAPGMRPRVEPAAGDVQSALDPWMTGAADGEAEVADVARFAHAEPKAERSLMHRCAISAPCLLFPWGNFKLEQSTRQKQCSLALCARCGCAVAVRLMKAASAGIAAVPPWLPRIRPDGRCMLRLSDCKSKPARDGAMQKQT